MIRSTIIRNITRQNLTCASNVVLGNERRGRGTTDDTTDDDNTAIRSMDGVTRNTFHQVVQ